jgi:hypothetical protein
VKSTCIYKIFVGKSEWKRPFVIHRRKREDNIKIDFKEIGYVGRVQRWALFNTVMNLLVP